jgi:tubulin polyglutamylase TTLL6/13
MQKLYENTFDFFPRTWILPSDSNDLKNNFSGKKAKTFIVKPVANCQGRGIYLTREFDKIKLINGEQYVVQRYMHKPYLIDGLKFDMRIYVLVYGVDPLRVFVFREGLARFATEPYQPPYKANMDNMCMHLTNYAINKQSDHFEKNQVEEDTESGHKRSVSAVLKQI